MRYIFLLSKNKKTLWASRFTIRRETGGRSMHFVPVSNGCVKSSLVMLICHLIGVTPSVVVLTKMSFSKNTTIYSIM
jgi:hypothetical protein